MEMRQVRGAPVRAVRGAAEAGVTQLPSVIRSEPLLERVHDWYVQSFEELVQYGDRVRSGAAVAELEGVRAACGGCGCGCVGGPPGGPQGAFEEDCSRILHRHGPVVMTVAQGMRRLREREDIGPNDYASLCEFLDRFFMNRIGIRFLLNQHLALFRDESGGSHVLPSSVTSVSSMADRIDAWATGRVGAIDEKCDVCAIASSVLLPPPRPLRRSGRPPHPGGHRGERAVLRAPGRRPEAAGAGAGAQRRRRPHNSVRAVVPVPHDVRALQGPPPLPPLPCARAQRRPQNSCRAVAEYHRDSAKALPPVEVTVVKSAQDLSISIADQGGGTEHQYMNTLMSYFYSTAEAPALLDEDDAGASMYTPMNLAPLAGFGYGLPVSRLYARYFGGDLNVMTMQGYGATAFVHLPASAVNATEVLPSSTMHQLRYTQDLSSTANTDHWLDQRYSAHRLPP